MDIYITCQISALTKLYLKFILNSSVHPNNPKCKHSSIVKHGLFILPYHMSPLSVFTGVNLRIFNSNLSTIDRPFVICIVWPSSIYDFWLSLLYLHTFLFWQMNFSLNLQIIVVLIINRHIFHRQLIVSYTNM